VLDIFWKNVHTSTKAVEGHELNHGILCWINDSSLPAR